MPILVEHEDWLREMAIRSDLRRTSESKSATSLLQPKPTRSRIHTFPSWIPDLSLVADKPGHSLDYGGVEPQPVALGATEADASTPPMARCQSGTTDSVCDFRAHGDVCESQTDGHST